jgi:MFS family permease
MPADAGARRSLARAVVAMWWVYASVGILIPVLPQYVTGRYGGGGAAIGVLVLVYGVANVAGRPLAGWYLRSGDPVRLMLLSVLAGVVALAVTPLAPGLATMLALRFVDGAAVGMFYTAAATGVVQRTAEDQRARMLSYFSLPLFLGTALGPVAGDRLIEAVGLNGTWLVSALVMLLAAAVCIGRVRRRPAAPPPAGSFAAVVLRPLVRPAAAWPSVVMALSIVGYAGFQALVPVYGPQIGLPRTGSVFLVYSLITLLIRVTGAGFFDRLPIVRTILVGCLADVAGLLVAWLWRAPGALFLAAGLMAVAIALQYVLLMKIALTGTPAAEQGAVVASYSVSYDIGAGLGGAALGVVVTATGSYQPAFAAGAICAALATIVHLARFWPRRDLYQAVPGTARPSKESV